MPNGWPGGSWRLLCPPPVGSSPGHQRIAAATEVSLTAQLWLGRGCIGIQPIGDSARHLGRVWDGTWYGKPGSGRAPLPATGGATRERFLSGPDPPPPAYRRRWGRKVNTRLPLATVDRGAERALWLLGKEPAGASVSLAKTLSTARPLRPLFTVHCPQFDRYRSTEDLGCPSPALGCSWPSR